MQFIGVNFAGGDDYRCRFSLGDGGEVNADSLHEVPAQLSAVTALRTSQHHLNMDAGLPLEPWLSDAAPDDLVHRARASEG